MAGRGTVVQGHHAPGFEGVRRMFESHFAENQSVGASVCVCIDGDPVVDLWGGHADEARTRPWKGDTIVNTWSVPSRLCGLQERIQIQE